MLEPVGIRRLANTVKQKVAKNKHQSSSLAKSPITIRIRLIGSSIVVISIFIYHHYHILIWNLEDGDKISELEASDKRIFWLASQCTI